MIGSAFALFGIIHVPQAGFKSFTDPTYEQCDGNTQTCWEDAKQLHYFIAYLMLAGTFALIWFAKKYDGSILDEIDDPSAHAFDNWFANAATGVVDATKNNDVTVKGIDEESDGIKAPDPDSGEVEDSKFYSEEAEA